MCHIFFWNIEMIKYHATYHRIINDFVGEMGVKLGQKSQNVELLEILDVLPKIILDV